MTKHILIVDDSEAIAYLFRRYFERYGFRVTVAHDGKSALAASKSDPIDGVVTDFRMPEMNGQDLLNCLRQDNVDLPAILVSAFTPDISVMDEITKVLSKPVEAMHLVYQMAELLVDRDNARRMKE